jgi:hypothetical protein
MAKRSTFLSAVGVTGAALALSAAARAADTPSPVPSESPKPSAPALATALAMRRFDPKLTDDQIATIAKNIDDNAKASAALDPPKHRLQNGEGPVTIFSLERA